MGTGGVLPAESTTDHTPPVPTDKDKVQLLSLVQIMIPVKAEDPYGREGVDA
jgi:hypothetical protein